MTFGRWLRDLDPRRFDRQASRVEGVAGATKSTREDVRHLQRAVERLGGEVQALRQDLERLAAVADGELDAGLRLDALVATLDSADLAGHVRSAVQRARLGISPVPHLVIEDLLPAAAYRFVVDAVPARVFARVDRSGRTTCRVPPALASTPVLAVWTLLTELMRDVLVPESALRLADALDARCRAACSTTVSVTSAGLDLAAEPGTLVYLRDVTGTTQTRTRPWEWLTIDVSLGGAPTPATGPVTEGIPFRPNSALIAVTAPDGQRTARLGRPSGDGPAFMWETRVGLSVDARRRLLSLMDDEARARWSKAEEESVGRGR